MMSLYIRAVDFITAMEIHTSNRLSKYFGMLRSHNRNIACPVHCYMLGAGKLNDKLAVTHTDILRSIYEKRFRK
jgi:hypothetical protein